MNKQILALGLMFSAAALAQNNYGYPVPKDFSNTPIYGGLGLPVYGATAITSATYADVLTVPLTGINLGRQYRGICVFNPSTTRSVSVCFGAGCTTAQLSVPAANTSTVGAGICVDAIYFGTYNDIAVIRAALDSAGTVTPQITIW